MVDLFMIKKAYAVQMTYGVSDAEKDQAEKALLFFTYASKLINMASEHLNIMKTPFKDNPEMSPDDIMKARAAIRRFRDKSLDNFNDFKSMAFKCVNALQDFASDTQTLKLMKSFITSIDDLEAKINSFVDLFSDLEAKDFPQNVVKSIESIQADCDDIEEIMDERIKDHIQTDILAKSWVDSVSNSLQMKVEKKTPLILDLFNKRQDQLNEKIKDKAPQSGS
jgi:replicative superfamily II helicase